MMDQDSASTKLNKSGGFQSMGLSWQVLKSVLNMGYKVPTPIQRKAVPEILLGKDVVAMARTGSGKTAAFLIPMFQRLQGKTSQDGPRALIMSPTRELALQTFRFTKHLGKQQNLKAAVILGGDKIEDQFEVIHENPDIIIATPGRFLHICIEMNLKLSTIEYVVFDEADRLFEMGFKEQLNEILHKLPKENRQTVLFSATLPASLVEFAKAGLQRPVLIRLDVETKLSENLKLAYIQARNEDKLAVLVYLLNNLIKPDKKPSENANNAFLSQSVIFVSTKHHVEFLREFLQTLGYDVSYAYSSLDQTARKINIAKFQNKKTSIMVVTDVAARGIDIPMLSNVINFNFPARPKLFVHRVGRVARAGQSGNAFSIVSNDELPYLIELHEFLGKSIKFAQNLTDSNDLNEVYGSAPQSVVDIERESCEALVRAHAELESAFQVQSNAQKQYLKSRQPPSSSAIKLSKKYRSSCNNLAVHPILRLSNDDAKNNENLADSDFLMKLKDYSTKTTIFEINKTSNNQQAAVVMRKKRKRDNTRIEKYQERSKLSEPMSLFEMTRQHVRIENLDESQNDDNNGEDEIKSQFKDLDVKISNGDETTTKSKKRKHAEIIDKEHFIPYKPKNFESERALGIHSSFDRQAASASFDMLADDDVEMRKNSQKMQWDRKKKKYVSTQDDKAKKFKTESGNYISKSYKSNLYSKWLKTSKANETRDDDGDSGDHRRKDSRKKFFGSSLDEKKFFGSHKFKSNGKNGVKRFSKGDVKGSESHLGRRTKKTEKDKPVSNNKSKKSNFGLKNRDQIMKERNRKAKQQSFQKKKSSSKKRK